MLMGLSICLAKSVIWRIQVPLSLKIKGETAKLWDDFCIQSFLWGGEPSLTYARGAVLEGSFCKVGNHFGDANTMLFSI